MLPVTPGGQSGSPFVPLPIGEGGRPNPARAARTSGHELAAPLLHRVSEGELLLGEELDVEPVLPRFDCADEGGKQVREQAHRTATETKRGSLTAPESEGPWRAGSR